MLYSLVYKLGLFGLLTGVRFSEAPVDLQKYSGIIFKDKTPVCIGAIVASTSKRVTMVTAAHCVRGAPNLVVSLGNVKVPINQVIIHPFYKPPLYDYDIAVLKIEFDGKNLAAMTLLPETEILGTLLVTQISTSQAPVGADATKVERQACQSKHGGKIKVSTKMICAQSGSNVLSGSPLLYKKTGTKEEYVLVGVASYSLNSSFPVIFTNINNSQIYKFVDQYI